MRGDTIEVTPAACDIVSSASGSTPGFVEIRGAPVASISLPSIISSVNMKIFDLTDSNENCTGRTRSQ